MQLCAYIYILLGLTYWFIMKLSFKKVIDFYFNILCKAEFLVCVYMCVFVHSMYGTCVKFSYLGRE